MKLSVMDLGIRMAPRFTALILALLFFPGYVGQSGAAGLEEGDRAPSFAAQDIYGNTFDLSAHIGKQVVVLKFGSIYCSSCVRSIADLAKLQAQYSEDRLKVVGVNLDIYGTLRVKKFYEGYRKIVNYPIITDRNLEISRKFGVSTLPSIVIIDRDGRIVRKTLGYRESELGTVIRYAARLASEVRTVELAGLFPSDTSPINIILPTNFTKTQQDSINIIGSVTKVGSRVRMTLNGGSLQEMTAERPMFYFRTPLSLSSNYIEVSLVEGGETKNSQAIVLFRDPKMGHGYETQFPTYHFHVQENEKICAKCHELTTTKPSEQNFMLITQQCLECHTEMAQKNYVHGPIMVGGCAPCHDFSSQPEKYTLFTRGSELCYSCHEEMRTRFARTYIHGPLAAGVCTVCHSPHGSNEKYQLRLPQGQMCMTCHQQIREAGNLEYQHEPFGEGQCSMCHDPHSSDNPEYFLLEPGDDLCRSCHDERQMEAHRHPTGEVPKFTFAGIRLNKAGESMCVSCHNPHGSDYEYMLPAAGCSACHPY